MKTSKKMCAFLIMTIMLVSVFSASALAFTSKNHPSYYYPYVDRNVPYMYSSYSPMSTYYPSNYYIPMYENREFLGGVSSPMNLLREIQINSRNKGWSVFGYSEEYIDNANITPANFGRIEFTQQLGRAYDDSLCLNIKTIAQNEVVALFGKLASLESIAAEGIETVALAGANEYSKASFNLTSVIKNSKLALKDLGFNGKKETIVLQIEPAGSIDDITLSNAYKVRAFILADGKSYDISDLMSDVHVRVLSSSDSRAKLVTEDLDILPSDRVWIKKDGNFYVAGIVPFGVEFYTVKK